MRQNLGGIGFWLTCKEKAGWGRVRKLLSAVREGGCGKLCERMWKKERKWQCPRPQKDTPCQAAGPGDNQKSSSLVLTHASYNKDAPAECSQEP